MFSEVRLASAAFSSSTLLSAHAAAEGEHGHREDPLQQEGDRADPRGGPSVDAWWRTRPVPVPELGPGSGRVPGPL